MRAAPPFLARLALAPDADERAVRRAYARELKLIDQERDPAGFQHLRGCYEAALAWVARRDAGMETAGDTAAERPAALSQAEPLPALPSPEQLADAVFEDFSARLAGLTPFPDARPIDDAARIAPWGMALQEALGDQRLASLDARLMFEHAVAGLLADGWRPAHHVLLVAACETFGWRDDRQTLRRLGDSGALLDMALEQRAMFDTQTPQMRSQQREVLSLLRGSDVPEVRIVRQRMRALRVLEQHFPALLHVAAPRSAVQAWHRVAKVNGPRPNSLADVVVSRVARWNVPKPFGFGLVLMALLVIVSQLMYDNPIRSSNEQPPALPTTVHRDAALTKADMAKIERLIAYRPDRATPPGEQRVRLRVWLDWEGKVSHVALIASEGDQAFTAAVERAVRASGPFFSNTPRTFEVEYHATVSATQEGPA